MSTRAQRYRVYGLTVETEFRFRTPMIRSSSMRATGGAARQVRFSVREPKRQRVLSSASLIYAGSEKNRFDESVVQLYAAGDLQLMRFPRIADFAISRGEIVCELHDPQFEYMIEICLLGHVFAYYLELYGCAALHAGAVALEEHAVLFVADRGTGKSTLVASLLQIGCSLIADDIAALDASEGTVRCRPGYPQMKLTAEQLSRDLGTASEFPRVHPDFDKLSVPVEALGRFCETTLPVGCIYVLERVEKEPVKPAPGTPAGRTLQTSPGASSGVCSFNLLSPGEALVNLVRHSFLAELLEQRADGDGLRERRLRRLGSIVQAVPVKRLRVASGLEMLAGVQAAVRDDLDRELGSRAAGGASAVSRHA